jgi:hypothetical protein
MKTVASDKLYRLFCGNVKDKQETFYQILTRYHNSSAVVISALQVAKHPFITPGPSTVFTPPPTRHSTLPGVSQGILAGITMTGSLPHYYNGGGGPTMTPIMGLRNSCNIDTSVCSSGYPTRPGAYLLTLYYTNHCYLRCACINLGYGCGKLWAVNRV